MHRHIVAGTLGLALILAGCAQDRTLVGKARRGVGGPVGLPTDMPQIHETVNLGPAGQVAAAAPTASIPAASSAANPAAAAAAAADPGPVVGNPRPQAPAPASTNPRPQAPAPEVAARVPVAAPVPPGPVAATPAPLTPPPSADVPDAVAGMTAPPAVPESKGVSDSLLGANPAIMPEMELPPATAKRVADKAGKLARKSKAPADGAAGSVAAAASDSLLGANPSLTPEMELPPEKAPADAAAVPANAPGSPDSAAHSHSAPEKEKGAKPDPASETPAIVPPIDPPSGPAPPPVPESLPPETPPPAALEDPKGLGIPAAGPGPISGALTPVEIPSSVPKATAASPRPDPSRGKKSVSLKSASIKPAADPLLGKDADVMPPIELPKDAPAPELAPETLPPPEAVPPLESLPPLADPKDPQAKPADPPKVGAAGPSGGTVDPLVGKASADASMIRSNGPARNLEEVGGIVARVGDDVITQRDVDLVFKERTRGAPPGQVPSPQERKMIDASILNHLIDRTLVLQEARRKLKDPKKLQVVTDAAKNIFREHEIPQLLRQYSVSNEYELKQKLSAEGQSLDDLRESFTTKFLYQGYIEQAIVSKLKVDVPEMRDYYNAHLKEFDRPAQITWREVVVEVEKSPSKAEARSKADAVLARILRGEDFAKIAEEASDGPTKVKGGLWETTPGSYGVAAVNAALEQLPLRQASQVIEGPTSYHVVRVEGRRQAGPARFDEVQDQVKEAIAKAKFERATTAFLDKIRSRAIVTTKYDGTDADPKRFREN